ncbi:hypothetical protein [Kribbella shirazensis]|uniref:ATP/GTP-binding protein n=1 Tax=Kribbella shirazensis TaxID=1105143 RepID=A0A7X5VGN1_9ACTN|nr:hypothetical protein [Kribbella shirazensis]NIK60925.1 hypothetical protein [Kribbella shirazensis]
MLRLVLRLVAGLLISTLALTTIAFAGTSTEGKKLPPKPGDDYVPLCLPNGRCYWAPRSTVEIPQDKQTQGKKPAKSTTRRPESVCFDGGAARSCTSDPGNWSNSHQCYLQRLSPQPPKSDPSWQGHTDGAIWSCVREQGIRFVTRWIWLPGRPDTVVIDPVTLAYQAIGEMQLAPPLVKTAPAPDQIGLVNMPVWLWVTKTDNTWGPIVRSASVPGLTVTVTARAKAINWSMGDGKTVRCEGPGTPYDASMGVKSSPTCGHRYVKTSHKLPNCKYPVTAVAQWEINWQSTLGDSGQISLTQQAATQLRIGEAVPVLVDPDGRAATAPPKAGC